MILINPMLERTKYTNKMIKNLFWKDIKTEFKTINNNIMVFTQIGNKYPMAWLIQKPTKTIKEYFNSNFNMVKS